MPENLLSGDRGQELLLPPGVRNLLADDHLAWFVLDIVDELDLAAFYGAYREDGHGRAAHDPAMTVALLGYAWLLHARSRTALRPALRPPWRRSAVVASLPQPRSAG